MLTRAEDFSFHVTSDWQTGYGASLELVNSGAQSLRDWRLEFDFASRIDTLWNARIVSHSGNHYVLAGESWSQDLAPGGRVSIGFNGSPGNLTVQPGNYVLRSAASPTSTPTPTASATPPPSLSGLVPSYRNAGNWGSGFQGEISITNSGTDSSVGWWVEFDLNASISSLWNGQIESHIGNHYKVMPASWSASLAPQGTTTLGFIASPGGVAPTNLKVLRQLVSFTHAHAHAHGHQQTCSDRRQWHAKAGRLLPGVGEVVPGVVESTSRLSLK